MQFLQPPYFFIDNLNPPLQNLILTSFSFNKSFLFNIFSFNLSKSQKKEAFPTRWLFITLVLMAIIAINTRKATKKQNIVAAVTTTKAITTPMTTVSIVQVKVLTIF